MNVGYEGFSNMQLLAFNGERVKSLRHLVHLADRSNGQFLRFHLFRDRLVVLEAAGVAEATIQICEDNSIPSPRSADLVDAVAPIVAGDAHEPHPPLAGVRLGRLREAEAEAQAESEEIDLGQQQQPQQQQQPTTGVTGGQPRQPSIAGAAVPARRKREPEQQSERGAAEEGRRAEPRRARWRSAAATALWRVGASAPMTKGSLRTEEGGGGLSSLAARREAGRQPRWRRRWRAGSPDEKGATGRRRLD